MFETIFLHARVEYLYILKFSSHMKAADWEGFNCLKNAKLQRSRALRQEVNSHYTNFRRKTFARNVDVLLLFHVVESRSIRNFVILLPKRAVLVHICLLYTCDMAAEFAQASCTQAHSDYRR